MKTRLLRVLTLTGLLALPFLPLAAQPAGSGSAGISMNIVADVAWLKMCQTAEESSKLPRSTSAETLDAMKAWLHVADQARVYRGQYRDMAHTAEAGALEALALIRAAEFGDNANRERLAVLVATVRTDGRLPERERFAVASRANELAIALTPKLDRAGRLAAYAQSARQMIAEFPNQPEPYQAMAALAEDLPEAAAGAALATELTALAKAPNVVKAQARTLMERVCLVGQSPDVTISDEHGAVYSLKQSRSKPLVVYTWSAADPASMAMARWLTTQVGDRVTLLGINLDADATVARAAAAKGAFAQTQAYAASGADNTWAQQLRMTRPGLVYLLDRKGVLRDVRGEQKSQQKLAALLAGDAP